MEMADLARSMMKRFRTLDGRSFYGELFMPPKQATPDNFDQPRRFLRTGMKADVEAGVIMLTSAGRRYLLANHVDNDGLTLQLKFFRLYEVNREVSWSRPGTVKDPVTGLDREAVRQEFGTIYCALEHPGVTIEAGIGTRKPTYRVITNVPLQLGDILDDSMKVIRVHPQLGVTFAEVQ